MQKWYKDRRRIETRRQINGAKSEFEEFSKGLILFNN